MSDFIRLVLLTCIPVGLLFIGLFIYALCNVAYDEDEQRGSQEWQK